MAKGTVNLKTLRWMEEQGLRHWKVEHHNAWAGKKYDLFGIIDYLGINGDTTVGVQACGADYAAHIRKLMIEERQSTKDWLEHSGRELVLIGWRKVRAKRGGIQMIYQERIARFHLNDGKLYYREE